MKSPNSCAARAQAFLDSSFDLKHKIKAMLQYFIYGKFAGKKQTELFKNSNHKGLAVILYFPAQFIFQVRKNSFVKRS